MIGPLRRLPINPPSMLPLSVLRGSPQTVPSMSRSTYLASLFEFCHYLLYYPC